MVRPTPIESIEVEDLNPHLRKSRPEWVRGVLTAANFINEHRLITGAGYLAGDVALFKFNLLGGKKKLRKVPGISHQAVEKTIRSIYQTWHQCALSTKDAKAMKLEPGRLCDVCETLVKAHMADFYLEPR